MVAVSGLVGLRPAPEHVARVTCPPYDVIKEGSPLEARLAAEPASLFHVTLGAEPAAALRRLRAEGFVVEDDEPSFYVYEQRWGDEARTGVFVAAAVSPYAERQIIRHEKTFDDKVKGRIALSVATLHSFGPVFTLTRAPLGAALDRVKGAAPLYDFRTDLGPSSDLSGIASRVWRVPEASADGAAIREVLGTEPLYIADGHHRYHASLLHEQTAFLCYVTEQARILAYNRVVNGVRRFAEIEGELALEPLDAFATPPKHAFCIYTGGRARLLRAQRVPDDVVGRLDCSILERELYGRLGLTHSMIADRAHFDYYAERDLDEMRAVVDRGDYDLAIALHPVSLDELMAVADAGLDDPSVVMPEKSTFFSPKILSGIFAYRHARAGG